MKGMSVRKLALLAMIAAASSICMSANAHAATSAVTRCPDISTGNVSTTKAQVQAIVCASSRGRLLIVGEIHGSKEVPELVAALLTDIARSRPVRLGLEMPVSGQASVQAYLRSSGSAHDRAGLLLAPFWKTRDGRSSEAMFQLIDSARALRKAGRDVNVFLTEPEYGDKATLERLGGFTHVKETGMAEAIRHELDGSRPNTFVIALMGNYHSRYGGKDAVTVPPVEWSVTEQLVSFNPYVVLPFAHQSEAWNCTSEGCAVHTYTSTKAPQELPRFVVDVSTISGPTVVKLWWPAMTASLPAATQDDTALPASTAGQP